MNFNFQSLLYRVVFRTGALAQLPEEVRKLGSRALVLSTPEQTAIAQQAADALGSVAVGIFPRAAMHVPVDIAELARSTARELHADVCVAIGGGSTIGLGKAIALVSDIPIIAVPTTYAGSEMTQIWGITADGVKKTGKDSRVLPKTVIYDPALTLTLPAGLSGTSGINALAHCAEALYAQDGNPITSLLAEEGIRALATSLPFIYENTTDIDARSRALYGAWLAGICLGGAGVALHHKLCHTLGGVCNLPHAETHTIVLPHALAYNARAVPQALERIARALQSTNAPQALVGLAKAVGAKTALKDLGMQERDIERVTEMALQDPYWNPEPITRSGVRLLISNAYWGCEPIEASGSAL
jgi:maleylacetate reductase